MLPYSFVQAWPGRVLCIHSFTWSVFLSAFGAIRRRIVLVAVAVFVTPRVTMLTWLTFVGACFLLAHVIVR